MAPRCPSGLFPARRIHWRLTGRRVEVFDEPVTVESSIDAVLRLYRFAADVYRDVVMCRSSIYAPVPGGPTVPVSLRRGLAVSGDGRAPPQAVILDPGSGCALEGPWCLGGRYRQVERSHLERMAGYAARLVETLVTKWGSPRVSIIHGVYSEPGVGVDETISLLSTVTELLLKSSEAEFRIAGDQLVSWVNLATVDIVAYTGNPLGAHLILDESAGIPVRVAVALLPEDLFARHPVLSRMATYDDYVSAVASLGPRDRVDLVLLHARDSDPVHPLLFDYKPAERYYIASVRGSPPSGRDVLENISIIVDYLGATIDRIGVDTESLAAIGGSREKLTEAEASVVWRCTPSGCRRARIS